MVRPFVTKRLALALYGVLLVLPTLVFGALYWRELRHDHDQELAHVPENAKDGARRVVAAMRERLEMLVESESNRPFYHYAAIFSPEDSVGDDLAMLPSPLVRSARPQGIDAWFSYDRNEGDSGEVEVFTGQAGLESAERLASVKAAAERFRLRRFDEDMLVVLAELGDLDDTQTPLSAVAIQRGHQRNLECLRRCSPLMRGKSLTTGQGSFYLAFYLEEDGTPRAVAWRRVSMYPYPGELPEDAECLKPLLAGFGLDQGFFLDLAWLLEAMPESVARQVLGESEELYAFGPAATIDPTCTTCAEVDPFPALGFRVDTPEEQTFGRMQVAINTQRMQERFAGQSRRFALVAAMLVLTIAIGMTLLYRGVSRELEHAERTQNFVAAVTHELRTPLSAIKLHGEMLLEGWTSDPEKQQEYYRRIVRETDRLATLVERVLEKSRMKGSRVEAVQLDLASEVRRVLALLPRAAEARDLDVHAENALPPVLASTEGVVSIVTNLVENARKYAPVEPHGEPIRIDVRREGSRVLLEVADRGPGVPEDEREKIFEAFYRIGSEVTRSAPGTGLGLHLVRLHAEAIGARASVAPREGGGSLFRVLFRPA